jgi:hypothetical protein
MGKIDFSEKKLYSKNTRDRPFTPRRLCRHVSPALSDNSGKHVVHIIESGRRTKLSRERSAFVRLKTAPRADFLKYLFLEKILYFFLLKGIR